jgi:hypothetical protein
MAISIKDTVAAIRNAANEISNKLRAG